MYVRVRVDPQLHNVIYRNSVGYLENDKHFDVALSKKGATFFYFST